MKRTSHLIRGDNVQVAQEVRVGMSSPTPENLSSLHRKLSGHDRYTGGHSARVANYAVTVARQLGLNRREVDLVGKAALVHDIGKVGVPNEILSKTGSLNDAEFALIRLHPTVGAIILSTLPGMDEVIPIVLHHHERWDGRGYPSGLSGLDIPLASRIILVVDAFDAMTTSRPYGKVLSPDAAMQEIRDCAGRQFDPLVAEAMQDAYDHGLITGTTSQP